MTQPAIFVSHGSPMLAISETPARSFLTGLTSGLSCPRAILVVSAHWETAAPMLNAVAQNQTIHDFFGFPPELYKLQYPAPGDVELAEQIADLLGAAGFATGLDRNRGLDHGAWVPLLLALPAAKIPVLQLSVQTREGPRHALALGRALAPLRNDGVLIIGSGSFTHDLRRFRGQRVDEPESPDVTQFSAWMDRAIVRADIEALVDYRERAPFARNEHPTEEHILPLFTVVGAGDGGKARRLHQSTEYGILRMDVCGRPPECKHFLR